MGDREGTVRSSRGRGRATSESSFRRWQTRGERLLHWFPELGKTLVREGEPSLESLRTQIESLRGQMSRRAQETGRDIEARAERLLADLERQAVRGLQPLLSRAHVASQAIVEALDRRVAHLEKRQGALLDDRAEIGSRVADLDRRVAQSQAELSERLREIDLRLAADDELRAELGGLREHLDALSKEQVTRNLEEGKLHDRIVRLEMRFGDLLKEQATQLAGHEEMHKRIAGLARACDDAASAARTAVEQAAAGVTAVREIAVRVTGLADQRALDRGTVERLERRSEDLERGFRQLELRVGDLTERHAALREEMALLATRVRTGDVASAATAAVSEHPEGH